jgi:hypothetical protein
VTAYLREITEDDFVFKNTIVAYMHANHNQIGVTDFGEGIVVHTRMYSNLFATCVVVADYQAAYFGVGTKIEYLGLASYHAIGKQLITFSDADIFTDDDIGLENCPFADNRAGVHKAMRPDYNALLYDCSFFNNRC